LYFAPDKHTGLRFPDSTLLVAFAISYMISYTKLTRYSTRIFILCQHPEFTDSVLYGVKERIIDEKPVISIACGFINLKAMEISVAGINV